MKKGDKKKTPKKILLPVSIVLGCFILGAFYFATQVMKQDSIERQQQLKIEQDNKEYIGKRKGECYDIYEKERDKWNNVDSHYYNTKEDSCVVTYTREDWKEGEPLFSGVFKDIDGDGIKDYQEGKLFSKNY